MSWFTEEANGDYGKAKPRKGSKFGVVKLPEVTRKETPRVAYPPRTADYTLPYFLPDGTLVIPRDCSEKYRWWQGGLSVKEIRAAILGETQV